MFRSFLSIVINQVANFDAFIQKLSLDIQKNTIENLWKLFHGIINIPFSTLTIGQERRKYKNVNLLITKRNKKHLP